MWTPSVILLNMFHFAFQKNRNRPGPHPRQEPKYCVPLTTKNLKNIFSRCADLQDRTAAVGGDPSRQIHLLWLDGMVSGNEVSEDILRPLTDPRRFGQVQTAKACLDLVLQGGIYAGTAQLRETADDAAADLLNGCCLVIFDREQRCISFEVKSIQRRGVDQPTIEKAVKGARDAFVETLRINTALVRRKLRCPELRIDQTTVGRKSHTAVAVLFLDGVADPALVEQVHRRLDKIDIDGLVAAGALEEYLVDQPRSPFPQLIHTERPDRFALDLLQGRVGLLVDGLPVGFLLPATLGSFLRVGEDNALHWTVASGITLLRYFALIIAALLPALYVAVAMYHQEMIPLRLLQSVIRSKQEVPFTTAVEIVSMLVSFELLQEAGLRLPDPIGQTVSIIGALIVGQSAVEASVISPIAVIIVALAGICGFAQPSQDMGAALRLWRFILVLAAILAGMVGVFAGIVMLVYHLSCLESFGLSYLSPLDQGRLWPALRNLCRLPLWKQKFRPAELHTPDKRNQR